MLFNVHDVFYPQYSQHHV